MVRHSFRSSEKRWTELSLSRTRETTLSLVPKFVASLFSLLRARAVVSASLGMSFGGGVSTSAAGTGILIFGCGTMSAAICEAER